MGPDQKKVRTKRLAATSPTGAAEADSQLAAYVYEKRALGWTFALICREGKAGGQERLSYDVVQRLGKAYDAKHGKPERIIRRPAPETLGPGPTMIPVRDLRNDSSRILRQVEAGRRFLITVSGHEIAELGPVASKSDFAPRSVVENIIREAPLDPQFLGDIGAALSQRVDEL